MKRSMLALLSSVLLTTLIFTPAALPASAYATTYHFNSTLAPWLPGSDFGEFSKGTLAREIGQGSPSCSVDSPGYASLTDYYTLDKGLGSWMVISIEAHELNLIEMQWDAINQQSSSMWCANGCDAVVYVGDTTPTDSSEFVVVGKLPEYWQTYKHSDAVRVDGTLYIAVGWRSYTFESPADTIALDKNDISAMVVGVDCLHISVQPVGK